MNSLWAGMESWGVKDQGGIGLISVTTERLEGWALEM